MGTINQYIKDKEIKMLLLKTPAACSMTMQVNDVGRYSIPYWSVTFSTVRQNYG